MAEQEYLLTAYLFEPTWYLGTLMYLHEGRSAIKFQELSWVCLLIINNNTITFMTPV